eukprot:2652869-Amphidinium_carterae.1
MAVPLRWVQHCGRHALRVEGSSLNGGQKLKELKDRPVCFASAPGDVANNARPQMPPPKADRHASSRVIKAVPVLTLHHWSQVDLVEQGSIECGVIHISSTSFHMFQFQARRVTHTRVGARAGGANPHTHAHNLCNVACLQSTPMFASCGRLARATWGAMPTDVTVYERQTPKAEVRAAAIAVH